jgi:16S rRNA (cytosine1402-N4)-methyltransferase
MRTQPIPSSGNTASSGKTHRGSSDAGAPSHEGHVSVLSQESLDALDIQPRDIVIDATLGGAGHATLIADKLGKDGALIGFDLDAAAIARAQKALAKEKARIVLVQANFRTMQDAVPAELIPTKAFFDLGWSSYQLSGRGMSFLVDEPLDMRYGDGVLTARAIVNAWEESSLADVIYGWGEDRFARRIARAIVEARLRRPIETTRDLADIVRSAVPAPARRGKIHPATKTFQALRIAVNDELGSLEAALDAAWRMLAPKGRIVVISFHSLEDRIVKHRFAAWEKKGEGKRLTKKPVIPQPEEIARNPRARSAKLRAIEKI